MTVGAVLFLDVLCPPPPIEGRHRLTERERQSLCELFGPEPLLAEGLGAQGGLPAHLPGPRSRRRPPPPGALPDRRPRRAAFADGVRLWRTELLNYFAEQRLRRGHHQQDPVIKRCAYGLARGAPLASDLGVRAPGATLQQPAAEAGRDALTFPGSCGWDSENVRPQDAHAKRRFRHTK
jgi:hypothetical protein